jgi:hypothetical protein
MITAAANFATQPAVGEISASNRKGMIPH